MKAAHLAIAQGSGAQMAKSVADLILVTGDFTAVPTLVMEGRRILRNLQWVAKLFVSKSVFAAMLILSVGIIPTGYPFLPRHLTLAATVTIGIPAFFLALRASEGRWQVSDLLRDVARFALPAGIATGIGVLSSYALSLNVLDLPLIDVRTAAETSLVIIGLYLILALEAGGPHRRTAVVGMCAILLALYSLVLIMPLTRDFFALALPGTAILVAAVSDALIAIGGMWITNLCFVPGQTSRVQI
jgi:magnesium-transporting ATPase (P-type)